MGRPALLSTLLCLLGLQLLASVGLAAAAEVGGGTSGSGGNKASVRAAASRPGIPTFTAALSAGSILVTVTPPANGGSPITSFTVQGVPVGSPAGTPTVSIVGAGQLVGAQRRFTFKPGAAASDSASSTGALGKFKPGMGYRFKVAARNAVGQGAFSALSTNTIATPQGLPCAPSITLVSTSGALVLVDVTPSPTSSLCSLGVSNYTVVGTPVGGGAAITVSGAGAAGPSGARRLTFRPGTPGAPGRYLRSFPATRYTFRARAANKAGNSTLGSATAAFTADRKSVV